ncbi:hypothetical protein S7711_00109 [Stachybotrys chartarum IBT 7711]|uniref:C2H2-type domain-containing protein n=1 Tax=Stachybotrys chartarum (strain CBS 109288 / IBT 7711) TaxID=1280523 RepID=A0A084B3G4_STACB|nr:hypothetical protein S7711_00109 [Stachybotrys chartarum IBT 7711]KFA52235.1 hypothetical protein S40293_00506 [Stachybotrys chartarum IBT 40293]KFA74787.1 hypothetical protein S40288_06635 [Stachybotrys chartarum IBT 40288]
MSYHYTDSFSSSSYSTYDTYGSSPPAAAYQNAHTTQPLAWSGSSDGSSYAPSTPTSPEMTYANPTQDLPTEGHSFYSYTTSDQYTVPVDYSTSTTPQMSSPCYTEEEQIVISSQDSPLMCLHPDCDARPKRRADLVRHYQQVHLSDVQKESYTCDYPRCQRRHHPFRRRDHFRDHLRDYHKEDIEKRGRAGPSSASDENWVEKCNVSSHWWRCSKCLHRVYISRNGYDCPECNLTCQTKRKEVRRRH